MRLTQPSATVFLGGGRITTALVAGLQLAGYERPILVHDRHPRRLAELKKHFRVVVDPSLSHAIAQARWLIVAVRPDSVSDLLRQIDGIKRPLPAVSLAAGIPLATLQSALPAPVQWARAMPSPACRSRRGLTAVAFAMGFPTSLKEEIKAVFARVGSVLEIPESAFDAFTVTYSCSHGYQALIALASEAEKLGLDSRTALTASAHALADGILAWRDGNSSLDDLLHEAVTPGGIAASVMSAMNAAGYQRAIARGLRAGMARARKNLRE
jgi:pyrroline-5-carboxylate reductase